MEKSTAMFMTVLAALLLVALAVTGVFLNISLQTQRQYRLEANNGYEQAYYQLTDSVGNMRVNLDKARVTRDPAMMCELMMDASVSCESAAQALYKFSANGYSASALTKFANQVGDYCAYLHSKAAKGEEITQSDYASLQKLSSYAAAVQEKLAPVRDGIGEGGYEFSSRIGSLNEEFSSIMNALQDGSMEYPSLIYDGPFSDGLDDKQAKTLSGEEITPERGAEIIEEKLESVGISGATYLGEGSSHFKTYLYSVENEHGSGDVQLAAAGGAIVQFSFNCEPSREKDFDSEDVAVKFVTALGYENMSPVWSAESDGVIYMNLCHKQDGVIIYPDMVKVKINSSDGHVTGCETLQYLFNHTQRSLEKPALSSEDILSRKWGELETKSVRLAVIPTPGGGERLAYEVYGMVGEEKFFVYADVNTGREVRVLKVVDSEQGELLI